MAGKIAGEAPAQPQDGYLQLSDISGWLPFFFSVQMGFAPRLFADERASAPDEGGKETA